MGDSPLPLTPCCYYHDYFVQNIIIHKMRTRVCLSALNLEMWCESVHCAVGLSKKKHKQKKE